MSSRLCDGDIVANERERVQRQKHVEQGHGAVAAGADEDVHSDVRLKRAAARREARRTVAHLAEEQQHQYLQLQQESVEAHRRRLIWTDRAYATLHGGKFTDPDKIPPPSFWRELRQGAAQQLLEPFVNLGFAMYAAAKRNARHTNEMMEQSRERGLPMNPIGASMAAGVSDTLSAINDDIAECKEQLVRALEAETKADAALHAFEAAWNLGKAGLGAYALAEPIAAVTDGGGAAGGMSMAAAGAEGGKVAVDGTVVAARPSVASGGGTAVGLAAAEHQHLSQRAGERGVVPASAKAVREKIDALRSGQDVRVNTVAEARALLEEMPDLRPATEDRLLPNPPRGKPPRVRMSDGFEDPPGTYRGDLINKQDPTGPVHPDVANPAHRNFPHYNIKFPDGTKAAIIIDG